MPSNTDTELGDLTVRGTRPSQVVDDDTSSSRVLVNFALKISFCTIMNVEHALITRFLSHHSCDSRCAGGLAGIRRQMPESASSSAWYQQYPGDAAVNEPQA